LRPSVYETTALGFKEAKCRSVGTNIPPRALLESKHSRNSERRAAAPIVAQGL
jgi:hypothetical protein